MTNINYDEGKKNIPDITWEPEGKDTVFILENGGGKTSYIQLLIQTILPNKQLGKRSLSETVGKGTNGFIATEWRLDGDSPQYLCLGFAFKNGDRQKNDLDYFTYLFTYNEDSDVTIDTLPMQKDGFVAKYTEYKKNLRNLDGVRVRIFDTISEHKEALPLYNIFPEEWDSISEINGEEGGVDKFFEKAKTTKKLIEKLLIPNVENAIFGSDSNKDEIKNIFRGYQKNLLDIPEYENNLANYKVIRDNISGYLDTVKEFSLNKDDRNKQINYMNRLFVTLEQKKVNLTDDIASKEQDIVSLEEELERLNWQKESYKVYESEQKIINLKNELNGKYAVHQETKAKLDELNANLRQLKAMDKYIPMKNEANKVSEYAESIENQQKSYPELKEKFDETRQSLAHSWSIKHHEKEAQVEDKVNSISILKSDISKEKIKQQDTVIDKDAITKELAGAEYEYKAYLKEKEDIITSLQLDSFDDLPTTLNRLNSEHMLLNNKAEDNQKRLSEIEKEFTYNKNNIHELNLELNKVQYNKTDLSKQKESVENELNAVLFDLKQTGKVTKDIFNDYELLRVSLENEKTKIDTEKDDYSGQIQQLRKELRQLSENDYYVPHHQLIDLKNRLKEKDVFVSLGSEWFTSQDLSISEKQSVLSQNPMLPYAILIEENQINEVKRALGNISKEQYEIPVLLQIKSKIGLKGSEDNKSFKYLRNDLMSYQHLNADLFMNKEVINGIIQEKEGKLESLLSIQKQLNSKGALHQKAIDSLEQFTLKYSETTLPTIESEITAMESEKTIMKDKINERERSVEELTQEKRSISASLKDQSEKLVALARNKERLDEFLLKHTHPEDIKKRIHALEKQLEDSNLLIASITKEVSDLEEKVEIENKLLNKVEQDLHAHKQEGREYDLTLNQTLNLKERNSNLAYDEVKNSYIALENDLNERNKDLLLLKETMNTKKQIVAEYKNQIDELDISLEWLEKNAYQVSDKDINITKEKQVSEEKKTSRLDKEIHSLENTLTKEQNSLEIYQETINEKYPAFGGQYVYSEDASAELNQTLREIDETIEVLNQLEEATNSLNKEATNLNQALMRYDESNNRELFSLEGEPLDEGTLSSKNYIEAFKKANNQLNRAITKLNHSKTLVDKAYSAYKKTLENTNSAKVRNFSRDMERMLTGEKLYDYNFVLERFTHVSKSIEAMSKDLEGKKRELERDKIELVDMAYTKVETIHKSVLEIQKNSVINLYGSRKQLVQIKWNAKPEEEAKHDLNNYITEMLYTIKGMKEHGKTEDEVNTYTDKQMHTVNLINQIAPIESCKITVFKPRKESLVDGSNNYETWDIAAAWSGGEQYTSYMTMYMILITHIRKKTQSNESAFKTIIADNPFGKASSEHILVPVMELAKKTNTQLFCLTAHHGHDITKHFEVVCSNRLYGHSNFEILRSTHSKSTNLKNLFYANPPEEKSKVASI